MELKFGLMHWSNVMSFGQVVQEIDLSLMGTVHIVGENLDDGGSSGSGKTTIMNVLCWLLWDKVPSGISKDRLINTTNDAKKVLMTGDLSFSAGKDEYLIKKTRGAQNTVQLFKNGVDETPASVAAFNAKLEEIIGYSFELFSQLVIFNGSAVPFLDLPARDQREMIEELFKITLLSRKAEKLKEMIKEVDGQLKLQTTLYERSKEQYTKDLAKYEQELRDADTKFNSWVAQESNRITEAVVLAEQALDSLKVQFSRWSEEEQARLAANVVSLQQESSAWETSEVSNQASRLQNLELSIGMFAPKLTRLAEELAATADATPERIAELAELDGTHKALTNEVGMLNAGVKTLDQQAAQLNKDIAGLTEQIAHLADNNCPFCKQTFADAKTKVGELESQLALKHVELTTVRGSNQELSSSIKAITAELEKLPVYDSVLHKRLVALHTSKSSLEAQLGQVNADKAAKQTELDFLRANPDSKRPNPFTERIRSAEQKLADFKPSDNPYQTKVALAEAALVAAQAATLDVSKNPHAATLEFLARNEPKVPDVSVETELNTLVKYKDHAGVLLKLLTDKNSFIRKGIIGKTMPFLNKRIAYYTQRLGLPHIVNFMPDLSTEITQMGRVLDHGNLSNGEKQRLNFSLCLSFRDALTYLHSRINLLVTDEIDGGKLDEQGINNIISLIKHKAWDDKLAIFNISHSPFFDSRCDRTLVVRKEGGFSRLIKQAES